MKALKVQAQYLARDWLKFDEHIQEFLYQSYIRQQLVIIH